MSMRMRSSVNSYPVLMLIFKTFPQQLHWLKQLFDETEQDAADVYISSLLSKSVLRLRKAATHALLCATVCQPDFNTSTYFLELL